MDALDFHGVSFVRIDAEGHWEKVIAGAGDLLPKAEPAIAMEGVYAGDPQRAERVRTLLSRLGYRHCCRLTERRHGGGRALPVGAPKFLRRLRPLHLEEIGRPAGGNCSLAINLANPILCRAEARTGGADSAIWRPVGRPPIWLSRPGQVVEGMRPKIMKAL